jgi:hypothetical protein
MDARRVGRQWTRLPKFGRLAVVFLAGMGVGAAVIYGMHRTNRLDGPPAKPQRAAFSEVPRQHARELAERFRPWLRFDSLERWRPLNVSRLLDERRADAPAHRLCYQGLPASQCTPIGGEAAFAKLVGEGSTFGGSQHLDLAGKALTDYHGADTCAPLLDCGGAPASAIYYHVTRSNDRYYIDYWWFLRFNDFYRSHPKITCRSAASIAVGACDQHEGDWEGVTVVTPPDATDALDYVVYAAHEGTFRYTASELTLHDRTRPEVFLARGSHAAYPVACTKNCSQPAALAAEGLLKLPEARFDGQSAWERNEEDCHADVPTSCLLSLPRSGEDPHSWTIWAGQWGAGCEQPCRGLPALNSPRSPGVQQRYQAPWCSLQGTAQTCDGKALGCSDWLGPVVAVVTCNPMLLAKALASHSERDPGNMNVSVAGRGSGSESSPGIVQSLGEPLSPGNTVTVTGGTPTTQVLVRAQRDRRIIEARFSAVHLGAGRRAVLKIRSGPTDDRVVLLRVPGKKAREADELRIVRPQTVRAFAGRSSPFTAGR